MMLKSVIDRRLYEEEKKINKLLEQVCLKADIKLDTQGFPIGLGNFSTKEPVSTQSAGTQTDTPFGAFSASGKLFASSDDVDDDDIHSERSKQESIQSQSNLSKGWEAMLLEQVMKENEFLIQNQEKEKQDLRKKIAELEQNLLEVIKWRNSTVNQSLFLISSFENKLSSGKEKGKSNKADLEKLISKLLYQLKSPLQEKINLSSQYAKNLLNQPLVNKSLSPAPSPLKSSQQLPVQYITQSPQVAEASNQPLEQFDKIAPQITEPVNIPPPQPQTESSNFSKPKLKQTNEPPPPPPPAESPLILKPSDYKQTKQAQSRPVSFPLRKTNNPLLNFDSNDNSPREHANNPNLDQSQPSSVPQPPPPPPMSSPAPKPSVPPPPPAPPSTPAPPATSPAPANPKSANAPPPPPAPGSDKKDLSIDPFSPMSSAKSPQKFLTDSQPSLSPSKIAQNADDANDSNEDHGKFYYCVKCKEYTLKMDLQLHEITIHSLFPFLTFEFEQSLLQLFYLLAQMQYFHTNYGSTHPLQRQKEIDRIQHYQVLSSSKDNQDETDKYRRQIIQMSYVTKNVFLLFFLIFELFDEKFPLSKGNQILDFCLITASKKSGKYRLKFNYADFIFAIFQLIQEKYKNFPNSSSKTPSPMKGRKPASIPQKTESMDPDQILIGKVQFFLTSTRELTEYYLTNPKDLDHLMTLYWDLTSDTLLPLFADNQALLYNNFKRTKSYGLYKSEIRLKKIDLIGGSFTPFENYCINYQLVPQLVPVSISRIITQDTKRLCGVENFTFFFFALYSTILYIARQDRTSNYNSVIPGRDGLKPASMPLERMKVILQQIIIQNDNEFS